VRIRTGYSFHAAVGHLDDVLDRVEALGWGVAPISDRVSTFGFTRWTKACAKRGLRPIFGVELAVVPRLGDKKPPVDYWTFFATDRLSDLHDLIRDATDANEREPMLTYANVWNAKGVVAIMAERAQLDMLPEGAIPNHVYLGLSPSTSVGQARRAIKRKVPLLATGDNYYPSPDDLEFYRVTLGSFRSGTQTYPRHIVDDEELRLWLSETLSLSEGTVSEAFHNRDRVMDRCVVQMQQARLPNVDKTTSLLDLCRAGAEKLGVDLSSEIYAQRLARELEVIHEKEFEDYFYILADLIAYAKTVMVVGPARGSSCGSLVCYLLGITAVDPVPYGLIFERFIDINRGGYRYNKEFKDYGPFPAPDQSETL